MCNLIHGIAHMWMLIFGHYFQGWNNAGGHCELLTRECFKNNCYEKFLKISSL